MRLTHITNPTGHSRISPRREVNNDVIAKVTQEIALPTIDYRHADYRVWGTYDGSSGMYAIYVRGHAAVLCTLEVDRAAGQATLAVDFATGSKYVTRQEAKILGDLERIIAWALMGAHMS